MGTDLPFDGPATIYSKIGETRWETVMATQQAKFTVGQIVHHRKFDYRGVIFDVDPIFQGSDDWYDQVARSRPPKDNPWYHVLVHGASHSTYVAEQHLEVDPSDAPVDHPALDRFFSGLRDGAYLTRRSAN